MLPFNEVFELPLHGTRFIGSHPGRILTPVVNVITCLRCCIGQSLGRRPSLSQGRATKGTRQGRITWVQ